MRPFLPIWKKLIYAGVLKIWGTEFNTSIMPTVYHVGGATLNTSNPKKTYLNFRNSLYTLTKNAKGSWFLIVFIRLVLDGLAAF